MAQLTGIVNGMNIVEGVFDDGKRKGQKWEFLSMTITDLDSGFVWSCQIPSTDKQYNTLKDTDLTRHQVQAVVLSQTASERVMPNGQKVMQIRSKITELEDLGAQLKRSA